MHVSRKLMQIFTCLRPNPPGIYRRPKYLAEVFGLSIWPKYLAEVFGQSKSFIVFGFWLWLLKFKIFVYNFFAKKEEVFSLLLSLKGANKLYLWGPLITLFFDTLWISGGIHVG